MNTQLFTKIGIFSAFALSFFASANEPSSVHLLFGQWEKLRAEWYWIKQVPEPTIEQATRLHALEEHMGQFKALVGQLVNDTHKQNSEISRASVYGVLFGAALSIAPLYGAYRLWDSRDADAFLWIGLCILSYSYGAGLTGITAVRITKKDLPLLCELDSTIQKFCAANTIN